MEINEILHGKENTLIIVRRDDLIEFANEFTNRINANTHTLPIKQIAEQPISQVEAVKFLGKSRQTLINWRKRGIINGYRLGGRIYYKPSELVSALQKLP